MVDASSLIIPPKDQIARVNGMLQGEQGTASNIKSRVNRGSVLGGTCFVRCIFVGTAMTEHLGQRDNSRDPHACDTCDVRSYYVCAAALEIVQ